MSMVRYAVASLFLIAPLSMAAEGWGEITATPVVDGIHVLGEQGGNIGVVIGDDGIFLIDDQFAPLTAKIRAKLDTLPNGAGKPVRFVLNTHFHGDHTGGNENFGNAGAVVVAHDNVRARMQTEEFRAQFLERGGENPAHALPVVTFNDHVTFHVNGRTLLTRHYPHAHTDGDSVVWFREDNVVHMGDIYFQLGYPFIDIDNGGSIDGVIDAVESVLHDADEDTVVVPGHGALSDAEGLREYLNMLTTLRDAVAGQLEAGRSLEEVKSLRLSKDHDARWDWQFISGDAFIEAIYRSLNADLHAGHKSHAHGGH